MLEKLRLNVVLNNFCDKSCSYCYEKNDGSNFVSDIMVQNFINKFSGDEMFKPELTFFGGEPYYSKSVIKTIMDNNPNFSFTMISNGSFLTKKNLDIEFINCVNKMKNVSFSLEGTEKAFKEIRNGENLREIIGVIAKNITTNVNINMSVNGILKDDIDELIENFNLIKSYKNLNPFYYFIKGDDLFKSSKEYYEFLLSVKEKSEKLYNYIINHDWNTDDHSFQFLCTYDSKLTLSCDGERIVPCARLNNVEIGKLNDSVDDILESYISELAKSHKSLYFGCANCEVPVSCCTVSCKSYIDEMLESEDGIQQLEKSCAIQKINHYLRIQAKESK